MNSDRKGKDGEREAVALLKPTFPEVRRSAMQGRGGHEQPDLLGTPGWWVEVGVGSVNPRRKYEQARADHQAWGDDLANPDPASQTPVAITRSDRGEWLVTMSAEAWLALLKTPAPRLTCGYGCGFATDDAATYNDHAAWHAEDRRLALVGRKG